MGTRSIEISSRFDKSKNIIGCEVGVRFGKNAEQLLEFLPRLTLHLVDRWEKPKIGDSYFNSGDGIADRPAGHLRKAFHETLRRTKRFEDRVNIIKGDSLYGSTLFLNDCFDFVFIDADHSFEGCARDIIAWLPKVKPGGFLCGHDYNHPRIGEVKKAVDQYLINVELGQDMTWFYRKVKS